MDPLYLSVGILVVVLVVCLISISNPIKLHRLLYSKSLGYLCLSFVTIVGILSVVMTLVFGLEIDGREIITKEVDFRNLPSYRGQLWAVLSQFLDPGNIANSKVGPAKMVAFFSAFLGIILLSGLLLSSFVSLITNKKERWQRGYIDYNQSLFYRYFFDNYVVIIGVNEQTASLIHQSIDSGAKYVLIQTRQKVKDVRAKVELKLDKEYEGKIVFYSGERTSAEDIAKLKLEKAREVYILGEDIGYANEEDHDAFNITALELINSYLEDHGRKRWSKLRVHVNFEYQSSFTVFKSTTSYQKFRKIEFVPFNIHEIWAKKVLVDNFAIVPNGTKEVRVQRYYPIDSYISDGKSGPTRVGITEASSKRVHLVIVGMNQMGTALAAEAAILCHFPNYNPKNKIRTTITFIDDNAKKEAEYFMGRFTPLFQLSRYKIVVCNGENLKYNCDDNTVSTKFLNDPYGRYYDPMADGKNDHLLGEDDVKGESFIDIQWEFIEGNIASKDVKEYVADITRDPFNTTTVAICLNDSQQAIAAAMYLPTDIYSKANQVLLYQKSSFDLVDDIAKGDIEWDRYPNLFPFGMVEGSYTENPFDNIKAKLLHCSYLKKDFDKDNLLNTIDSQWDLLRPVDRYSNINSVDSFPFKYSSLGITDLYNYEKISVDPFGMVEGSYTENPLDNSKAKCNYQKKDFDNDNLLKTIDSQWDLLGLVDKYSNINSVDSFPFKYRSLGITDPYNYEKISVDLGKMIASEHQRWLVERLFMGFRFLTEDEQKQFESPDSMRNSQIDTSVTELINRYTVSKESESEVASLSTQKTEEFELVDADKFKKFHFRKKQWYKTKERAHLDICSLSRLSDVDPYVIEECNDEKVIRNMPELLRKAEMVSVMRLSDLRYINSRHVKALRDILSSGTGNRLHFHFIEGTDCGTNSFWMAETPVTQQQWEKIMGVKSKMVAGTSKKFLDNDMPVVNVSKLDVDDFLTVLRKKTGLCFDLPSKDEWQCAAYKTKDSAERHKLDRKSGVMILVKYFKPWIGANRPIAVSKMARFQKSDTEIRHILGNVWEWTRQKDDHGRFFFCGGSWRFTSRETEVMKPLEPDKYKNGWYMSWEKEMKSTDIGFRLIWRYDTHEVASEPLYKNMCPSGVYITKYKFANWFHARWTLLCLLSKNIGSKILHMVRRDVGITEDAIRMVGSWFDNNGSHRMVLVKEGDFVMGANENEDPTADDNERPRHNVHISHPYFICNIPVTQKLWNLLSDKENPTTNSVGDDYPQTDVSWDDARDFIDKLNLYKNRLSKAMPEGYSEDMVFRLPTEAEWEYAAKGGHTMQKEYDSAEEEYPLDIYGEKRDYKVKKVSYEPYSGSSTSSNVAWCEDIALREVAKKQYNSLELYDMSGNVWEWCHDLYIANAYNSGNVKDPLAPDEGYVAHVFRGGSWKSTEWDCRCTRANFWASSHRSNDLGFRLVLGKPLEKFDHNVPFDIPKKSSTKNEDSERRCCLRGIQRFMRRIVSCASGKPFSETKLSQGKRRE